MAARDERPQAHVIEPARSGRSMCQSCGKPIIDGDLRLSEAFVSDEGKWARAHRSARSPKPRAYDSFDEGRRFDSHNPDVWARFHHLICAAEHQPYKLQSALATTTIELPQRAELERAIERALSAVDVAEENESTRDEYQRFVTNLREEPDDEMLLVFGDWLQNAGDPRGELVQVQHSLETATGDEKVRLLDGERKLLAVHRKQLMPERLEATLQWRRGFVHRLTLKTLDTAALGRAFTHPSLRLLRELVVESENGSLVIAANLPPLPATLRVLELTAAQISKLEDQASRDTYYGPGIGRIGAHLANAPKLERLKLSGSCDLDDIKHPQLAELELVNARATLPSPSAAARGDAELHTFVERLAALERRRLPKLERLILHVHRELDAALAALAGTNILKKLTAITLRGDLTGAGLAELKSAKVKLEVLDLRGTSISADHPKLKGLAASVLVASSAAAPSPAAAAKKVGEWLVKHTRRPEWGIGRVVAELDEGLEVEFENGGKKQVRNVELLEEIEST